MANGENACNDRIPSLDSDAIVSCPGREGGARSTNIPNLQSLLEDSTAVGLGSPSHDPASPRYHPLALPGYHSSPPHTVWPSLHRASDTTVPVPSVQQHQQQYQQQRQQKQQQQHPQQKQQQQHDVYCESDVQNHGEFPRDHNTTSLNQQQQGQTKTSEREQSPLQYHHTEHRHRQFHHLTHHHHQHSLRQHLHEEEQPEYDVTVRDPVQKNPTDTPFTYASDVTYEGHVLITSTQDVSSPRGSPQSHLPQHQQQLSRREKRRHLPQDNRQQRPERAVSHSNQQQEHQLQTETCSWGLPEGQEIPADPCSAPPTTPQTPASDSSSEDSPEGAGSVLLYRFLMDELENPRSEEARLLAWVDRPNGLFRIVHKRQIADKWGKAKNNTSMTYDKFGRSLRYYYKVQQLVKVTNRPGPLYKFGPHAHPDVWRTIRTPGASWPPETSDPTLLPSASRSPPAAIADRLLCGQQEASCIFTGQVPVAFSSPAPTQRSLTSSQIDVTSCYPVIKSPEVTRALQLNTQGTSLTTPRKRNCSVTSEHTDFIPIVSQQTSTSLESCTTSPEKTCIITSPSRPLTSQHRTDSLDAVCTMTSLQRWRYPVWEDTDTSSEGRKSQRSRQHRGYRLLSPPSTQTSTSNVECIPLKSTEKGNALSSDTEFRPVFARKTFAPTSPQPMSGDTFSEKWHAELLSNDGPLTKKTKPLKHDIKRCLFQNEDASHSQDPQSCRRQSPITSNSSQVSALRNCSEAGFCNGTTLPSRMGVADKTFEQYLVKEPSMMGNEYVASSSSGGTSFRSTSISHIPAQLASIPHMPVEMTAVLHAHRPVNMTTIPQIPAGMSAISHRPAKMQSPDIDTKFSIASCFGNQSFPCIDSELPPYVTSPTTSLGSPCPVKMTSARLLPSSLSPSSNTINLLPPPHCSATLSRDSPPWDVSGSSLSAAESTSFVDSKETITITQEEFEEAILLTSKEASSSAAEVSVSQQSFLFPDFSEDTVLRGKTFPVKRKRTLSEKRVQKKSCPNTRPFHVRKLSSASEPSLRECTMHCPHSSHNTDSPELSRSSFGSCSTKTKTLKANQTDEFTNINTASFVPNAGFYPVHEDIMVDLPLIPKKINPCVGQNSQQYSQFTDIDSFLFELKHQTEAVTTFR